VVVDDALVESAEEHDYAELIQALKHPDRLWTRAEVLARPSPVPPAAGIYGWHFLGPLAAQLDVDRLHYVGIAPRHMSNRTSSQNLRTRIRYHLRGNAAGSTLRLTLGCLLGLELRRVGSGNRLTFGSAGETELNAWLDLNARLCWYTMAEPWTAESAVIAQTDLPLNLDQNRSHPFSDHLRAARAQARTRARGLPVAT
jgi:hypothetical protein